MNMKLSNETYDILKYAAQVGLPAIATFLTGILVLWDVDEVLTAQIAGTVVLVNTLLGALLMLSTARYNQENKENMP